MIFVIFGKRALDKSFREISVHRVLLRFNKFSNHIEYQLSLPHPFSFSTLLEASFIPETLSDQDSGLMKISLKSGVFSPVEVYWPCLPCLHILRVEGKLLEYWSVRSWRFPPEKRPLSAHPSHWPCVFRFSSSLPTRSLALEIRVGDELSSFHLSSVSWHTHSKFTFCAKTAEHLCSRLVLGCQKCIRCIRLIYARTYTHLHIWTRWFPYLFYFSIVLFTISAFDFFERVNGGIGIMFYVHELSVSSLNTKEP